MTKTLKINKPAAAAETRKPVRGRNRNNHVAPTPYTDKPRDASDKPRRSFDDKPKRDFGDRPARPYGDKPRDAADKPRRSFDDKPKRDFGDRPARPYGDKPRETSNPYGNAGPSRSFNDKPSEPSSLYGKPHSKSDRPRDNDASPYGKAKPRRDDNPYAPTFSSKKNQEPRRHGKLRDENGRPIREVMPRLAPLDAGIRLSKQLSDQGLCSRREADEFIEKGWVTVNGQRATLGQRVLPTDRVQVAKQAERAIEARVTILINKPVGLVSGQAEDGYAPAVSLVTPENQWMNDIPQADFEHKHLRGLAPAGRLDIDSVGLLVLTQDGRVAKTLIGDKSDVDKEYLVRVEGELSAENLRLLNHGLELDGVPLRPAKVTWQNEDQLRFVLRGGKKRQIRRMCELVGLHVVGLKRIRIGNVVLGDLPTGMWRYLGEDEAF